MPDEPLFQAAADGSLVEETVFSEHVQRLLNDEKARETVALFHRQWLGLSELSHIEKDPELHPEFTPALALEMLDEQARFTQQVVLSGDGLLSTLFNGGYSYPSAGVSGVYGVPAPAQVGERVVLSAAERAGLLTQPGFLAAHAKRSESSPVHRGIVVRENVLCQVIPPPPPGVDTVLPPREASRTTRERFARHLEDPSCAGCHRLMDPIGLGFEHYDAIGRYRETEGGLPIDATGEIVGSDSTEMFDGVVELSAQLAQSTTVSDCVARQWFRFSLGRVESESDACSILSISETLESSGGNVRSLIERIALSESFKYVRTTAGE